MSSLYTAGIVLILLSVIALIVFYGYKLARTQRSRDTTDERLRAMMVDTRRGAAGVNSAGNPAGPGVSREATPMALPWSRGRSDALEPDPSVVGQVRTYDGAPGLRSLSEQPIFLRKDSAGDVVFQVEDRRATPVKYVLEPRIRQILSQVVVEADRDFGKTWAVLASEDLEGKLVITRLL
jgi:hypothetical protein